MRDWHPKLSADLKLVNVMLAKVNVVICVVILNVRIYKRVTVNEPIVEASNQKCQLETSGPVNDRIADQGTLGN